MNEEDEAFDAIDKAQGWRKRQVCDKVDADIDPYTSKVRNDAIEEVARAVEKFRSSFGADTISSFAIFIRGMKR